MISIYSFSTATKIVKSTINCMLLLLLIMAFGANLSAQIDTNFPCYTVAEDNSPPNTLFEYDPAVGSWQEVSVVQNASLIEAIAADSNSDILYATDGGSFGFINVNNAIYTPIGTVGTANGDLGPIALNDVDGLSYDEVNNIMYATHRRGGVSENDLLFIIDVSTGLFVPNAMLDSNGNPADYAVVEEAFDGTLGADVYDVDDIAIDRNSGVRV